MSITYPILLPGLDLPNDGTVVPIASIRFKPRSVVAFSPSPFTLQQQVQVHQGMIWAADVRLGPQKAADAQKWIAALLSLNGMQGTFKLGDPALRTPRGTPTGTPLVDGANQTGQSLATKGWGINSTGVLLKGDWIQIGAGSQQRIYRVLNDVDSVGVITAVTLGNGGTGYTLNDILTVIQSGANGGTVKATGVTGGVITAITLQTGGSGYSVANGLATTGGTGTGATVNITQVIGKATLDIWPRLRESPANEAALTLSNTMGIFRMSDNEMIWDIDVAMFYGIEFTAIEAI